MTPESPSSLSAEYGALCGHRDALNGLSLYPLPKTTAFGMAYHASYSGAMKRKTHPNMIIDGPAYVATMNALNRRVNWIVQSKGGNR
jgi:hypothetical protein